MVAILVKEKEENKCEKKKLVSGKKENRRKKDKKGE
jgi:hypothetical protein